MAENLANKEWVPKIVAIVCNWCTYAGADLAGISRIQYPPNVRIIRVPCTGRINPFYIEKTFNEVSAELGNTLIEKGKEALTILNLTMMKPEIVKMI